MFLKQVKYGEIDLARHFRQLAFECGVGRFGHGLGLHLTEPHSNRPNDRTELKPDMIMTIEPGLEFAPGKNIVHEEKILITEESCELLTRRAAREMVLITV